MGSSLAFKLETDFDSQDVGLRSVEGSADLIAIDLISPEFAAFNQTPVAAKNSRRPNLHIVGNQLSKPADSPQFGVAGSYRRLLAHYLDSLVLLMLMVPAGMHLLRNVVLGRDAVVSWFWMGFTIFVWALYQVVFLKKYGATAGKSAMDLRVVSLNPTSPQLTWTQACVRAFSTIVAGLFGYLFYAVALLRKDRRHVVDLIAQTQVIQDGLASRHKPRRLVIGTLVILSALIGLTTQQKYKITSRGLEFKKSSATADRGSSTSRKPAQTEPQQESNVD